MGGGKIRLVPRSERILSGPFSEYSPSESFFARGQQAHRQKEKVREASLLLVHLLEGEEGRGPLSRALREGESYNLSDAFRSLSLAQQIAIRDSLGERNLRDLFSLSRETDSELLFQNLLHFALLQEKGDRLELAAAVYSFIAKSDFRGSDAKIVERARKRLDAILGRGAVGPRLEFLVGRLAKGATDPSTLFAMGMAGAAFKLTRFLALNRLLSGSATSLLTRGFGARATAGLIGFSVEAPVFTLAGKSASELLGREQDWSRQALRHEIASSFLVLGGLKLGGWGSSFLFNKAHGITLLNQESIKLGGLSRVSQTLLPQAGMLGGILLGHKMEELTGLRGGVSGATTLTDSLALLFQFNVAGRLTRWAFGERFHRWERGLDRKTEEMARNPFYSTRYPPQLQPAGLAPPLKVVPPRTQNQRPAIDSVSMMVSWGRRGSPKKSQKVISLKKGALAVEDEGEKAINWLLGIRQAMEEGEVPKGFSKEPDLRWIPMDPVKTVLLNEFGVVLRPIKRDIEQVNRPGKIPIKALPPFVAQGEAFVVVKDIKEQAEQLLTRWRERKEKNTEAIFTWDRFNRQLESLYRKREGVREMVEEGGKKVLVYQDERRQMLPPSLDFYVGLGNEAHRETRAAFRSFQNQFWGRRLGVMAGELGSEELKRLPKGMILTEMVFHNDIILSNYATPLKGVPGLKIFFVGIADRVENFKFWVADASGENLITITKKFPRKTFGYLKGIWQPLKTERPKVHTPSIPQRVEREVTKPGGTAAPGRARGKGKREIETDPTQEVSVEDFKKMHKKAFLPFEDTGPEGQKVIGQESTTTTSSPEAPESSEKGKPKITRVFWKFLKGKEK